MELSNRIKRSKARIGMAPVDQAPPPDESADDIAAEGGTFDRWLDGRLQALYRTVLNEPLPREITDLLSRPKGRN